MPLPGLEARILVLNADPVFQDKMLDVLAEIPQAEARVVRSLSEAIAVLLEENFDGFICEAEPPSAVEQAVNIRQHFPSLRILCVTPSRGDAATVTAAQEQNIRMISAGSTGKLRRGLAAFVQALEGASAAPTEGIDPCHSLIGNLNQFSAAEILQMSCLSQRSGRFTFKSSRGNSEIYLQQGSVRHAVYGTLEGESAVAEIFRWRQGRFYFEEGIISQEQTVNRPWAHLLIDNLQKLDETLELVGV
ncbi:MAG TPA: DUF4388 domain-containing protein [Chthoniobacterales bacterium]|nr:DUF4388 domain-containing protein [Chthoniobacterales bacterium]